MRRRWRRAGGAGHQALQPDQPLPGVLRGVVAHRSLDFPTSTRQRRGRRNFRKRPVEGVDQIRPDVLRVRRRWARALVFARWTWLRKSCARRLSAPRRTCWRPTPGADVHRQRFPAACHRQVHFGRAAARRAVRRAAYGWALATPRRSHNASRLCLLAGETARARERQRVDDSAATASAGRRSCPLELLVEEADVERALWMIHCAPRAKSTNSPRDVARSVGLSRSISQVKPCTSVAPASMSRSGLM